MSSSRDTGRYVAGRTTGRMNTDNCYIDESYDSYASGILEVEVESSRSSSHVPEDDDPIEDGRDGARKKSSSPSSNGSTSWKSSCPSSTNGGHRSTPFATTDTMPPTFLCIGLSDMIDGALARAADLLLDCITFRRMEDACREWTNVPAKSCKFF
ncbi:hypothetical protein ACHAXA_004992 [Cyclostephanos tholiformis]|uniref:Uncharacterized protein n=1 Tax=Cyclostephanos tholiformis TaxID=382380 RepID=A0ABD3R829_9STRA